MNTITYRRLRRTAALLSACAVVGAGAVAGSARAITHAAATTPITHIVVLMQENHSFGSELGGGSDSWCGLNPSRCMIGSTYTGDPAQVNLSNGTQVAPSVAPDIVPPVNHSVASQQAGIDGGKMDGWQNIVGCQAPTYACISYYPASAVPNLASLASQFTVLDQAYTMFAAPSFAGHLALIAGTIGPFSGNNPYWQPGVTHGNRDWGCDSNMVAQMQGAPKVAPQPACDPAPIGMLDPNVFPYAGAFEPTTVQNFPTVLDQLSGARVSWNIFGAKPTDTGGAFWSACPLAASCLDTSEFNNVQELNNFFPTAQAGTLPSVSFVFPEGTFMQGTTKRFGGVYSQHNSQSNSAGDNFVGQVASAVMSSPEWSSTALVIAYDDCGCFYDSVAPPAGEGLRVPFVLVSPYALPANTDQTSTTSTGSILAFIENSFGLPYLTPTVAAADNLSSDFNFNQVPLGPAHMIWRKLPASAYRIAPSTLHDPT